ncbi:MAG: dihydrofolate reductase [Patescibacteria group bacterium]|nr:dihydrofolate reductase [Patescibacteria group bacterium]
MHKPRVSMVAAIGKNRVLGKGGGLLWHIPEDLKRFKRLTLGHPIIMGRKTFESIAPYLKGPLPGRTNIVLTRDPTWGYEGVFTCKSLEEALKKAGEFTNEEIFIGGGGELYTQALPYADKLYLTIVKDEKEGDAFFPPYERYFTKKVFEEEHEWNGVKYTWIDFER